MDNQQIADLLKEQLELAEVHVTSEGSHFQIIAVSDKFESMSRVKKQQFIYGPLKEQIADGTMHAISIKTFSEKQWQRERMFNVPQ
ncbi:MULTISPECIES: BolA family protein [Alteromonadaceae]|uniref:BolA family protein n=1 Tax=Alteromonadaceae TaxID=72275 RepID=UPI001C08BD2D|nr:MULTISPECIES: BolA family protein [Aliiglaciecola]MBU2879463.1 BolA family transcriptional regulator [Aliiglaciecola lipolytica]MDO6712505.1 BolA family protein [Aliiglaciecola sp. 2_MG-2023]MDO6753437.1 BolA family protein [Aliiglaciecola sp. 1_MG-2023]